MRRVSTDNGERFMGKKRQFRQPLSQQEVEELSRVFTSGVNLLGERQERLLSMLDEYGPKRFTWILANVFSDSERAKGLTPDPRFYPSLREKLEILRKRGWPTEEVVVSRVGRDEVPPKLRIELPLTANIKEYLPAIQAYQEFFTALRDPNSFPSYIVSRYTDPYEKPSLEEIIEEINEGIIKWANGRYTHLNMFGLDAYLTAKGYTPTELRANEERLLLALFNEDKVRRLIKYHQTKK
jgi:hypothetical protein